MKKSRYWPIDERLAHWHPVARTADLGSKPLAREVCGVPVVLYRDKKQVHALYDRCAHRRAPLSIGRIEEDRLVCVYHGCSFAADGSGYCPTTKSNRFVVPSFETRVLCDTIWLRSPDAVEWTGVKSEIAAGLLNPEGEFAGVIQKEINAPLQLVVDNMTELEHTGEVHRMLAFGPGEYDTIQTHCEMRGDDLHIFYRGQQRPLPLYLRLLTGLKPGDIYVQTADVSFTPPHADYRITWQSPDGGETRGFSLCFIIYYTPITPTRTQLFSYVFWTADGALRHLAMKISPMVLRQIVGAELDRDKRIIELLPPDEATIQMFQLNKFDRPLVHTRETMARLYPEREKAALPTCDQACDHESAPADAAP